MKNMMKIISEILPQETSNARGLVELSVLIFSAACTYSALEFDQNERSYLEKDTIRQITVLVSRN